MTEIMFPFKRECWYTLEQLTTFKKKLLLERRQDTQLDHDLRLSQQPWMKLLNAELYPLYYFAKQIHLSKETLFRICAEGADADLELKEGSALRRLQVTQAGAVWPLKNRNWGYEHKLSMTKLNSEGESSGFGPFIQNPDGSISDQEMVETEERNRVCLDSLVKTLEGKQNYRIPDCELIVHAVAYRELMDQKTFINLASEALRKISLSNFRIIYILDSGDGYFYKLKID